MPIPKAPLKAAQWWLETYGLCVMPLTRGGKTPVGPWARFQRRCISPTEVKALWRPRSRLNVAAVLGRVSGSVMVVDYDPRNAAQDALADLELPDTLTIRTGGGGRHWYYRLPRPLRKGLLRPGVELLCQGQYAVLPPSIHPNGAAYSVVREANIAPAPEFLIRAMSGKPGPKDVAGPATSPGIPSNNGKLICRPHRHDAVMRSVRGYARTSRKFCHLWKRAVAMVRKWVVPAQDDPFTRGELFGIVLWAWNQEHPKDALSRTLAVKMLVGRQRKEDICFGSLADPLPSFHPNIQTSQQPNNSTSQDYMTLTEEILGGSNG